MSSRAPSVDRVLELVRDVLQVDVRDPGTDLIGSGLIDSLMLVSLITEIERDFGIQLPLEDFEVESFRSPEQIADYVATAGSS